MSSHQDGIRVAMLTDPRAFVRASTSEPDSESESCMIYTGCREIVGVLLPVSLREGWGRGIEWGESKYVTVSDMKLVRGFSCLEVWPMPYDSSWESLVFWAVLSE